MNKNLLLFIPILLIFNASCNQKFEKSTLEKSNKEIVALYAACLRSNSDGLKNTNGSNISFCDNFKDLFIKEEKLKICSKYFTQPECFRKIFSESSPDLKHKLIDNDVYNECNDSKNHRNIDNCIDLKLRVKKRRVENPSNNGKIMNKQD